ncbi:MAG: leucyl aminopeptidase [Gammaproteobacteria bacterium]|nr:leucyl aminopeptidase [Gammaproteobacteria bacterium]
MDYLLKSGAIAAQKTACLVVGVYARRDLSDAARALDEASGGALESLLKQGDFTGQREQSQLLYDLPGCGCARALLIGLGPRKEFTLAGYREACARAAALINDSNPVEAISTLPTLAPTDADLPRWLQEAVVASEAATYRFDRCKSEVEKPKRPLRRLGLFIGDRRRSRKLEQALANGKGVATGMALAKDLSNLPGNLCTPGYLADQARSLGRKSDKLKVQILEEKQMQELGMGALLSVSRGSRQPAKLIVMEYGGGKPDARPVALVGKGLTFDAGGISIKPSAGMDEMKYDMCGGASVIGAMAACVELQLPLNVVGIVPASENLPDGDANKPGDIVTSMSGLTVEVLNTDAEGRLILCDALTYTQRFKPSVVIDIATLTGACVVALGAHASGLFSNDEQLAQAIIAAGKASGDRAWQLPMWDDYQGQLDSNFADMANVGGREAGAITAGCFLSRFTKKMKWAHLDIAGTAWKKGTEKGATGRPVPLLMQFLLQRCGLANE